MEVGSWKHEVGRRETEVGSTKLEESGDSGSCHGYQELSLLLKKFVISNGNTITHQLDNNVNLHLAARIL
jgi:hypothetical protein